MKGADAMFEPGWLQDELNAASVEVASWPPGMRRLMDGMTIDQEILRDAKALIRKSLGRFGQEIGDKELLEAAIKLVGSLPKHST